METIKFFKLVGYSLLVSVWLGGTALAQLDDPFSQLPGSNGGSGANGITTTPPELAQDQVERSKNYIWQDASAIYIRTPVGSVFTKRQNELADLAQKYVSMYIGENAEVMDQFEDPDKYIKNGTFKSVTEVLDKQITFQNELDSTLQKIYQVTDMRGHTQMPSNEYLDCKAWYLAFGFRATKVSQPAAGSAEGGIVDGFNPGFSSAVPAEAAGGGGLFAKWFGWVPAGVTNVLRPLVPKGFWAFKVFMPVQYIRIDKLGKNRGKARVFIENEKSWMLVAITDLKGFDDTNAIWRAGVGCFGGNFNTLSQLKGAVFGSSLRWNPLRTVSALGKMANMNALTKWADSRKHTLSFNFKYGWIKNSLSLGSWPDINYKMFTMGWGNNFNDSKGIVPRLNFGAIYNIFSPTGFDMSDLQNGGFTAMANPTVSSDFNINNQYRQYVANTKNERKLFLNPQNQSVLKNYSAALISKMMSKDQGRKLQGSIAYNDKLHRPLGINSGVIDRVAAKYRPKGRDS